MKLVIDIDEAIYDCIKRNEYYLSQVTGACKSIANGMPLPQHKGRLMLVDIDELPFFRCPNNVNKCPPSYDFTCQNCDYGITSRFRIERMGTLIESKKEKENE